MKPTVLMDCDGVIFDFVTAAVTRVNAITGAQYRPEDVTTWEVFDSIPVEQKIRDAAYGQLKAAGGCASIPVYPEAVDGIRRLREIANIIAVTSPFEGSPTWMHERTVRLRECFDITEVIHAVNKERIHGDAFVDDKPSHATRWSQFWQHDGRNPWAVSVLWRTPRTCGEKVSPGIVSAATWDEVCTIVRGLR
jgi:5'(3')-deoxyribonucleotidase